MLAERGADVTGYAEVVAVNVNRVRKTESVAASARVSSMARGVTLRPPIGSSRPVTLRCPVFQASTPPGFTILIAYAPVDASSHAA